LDLPNSLEACPIKIARELGMLNEGVFLYEILKGLNGNKMILLPIDLSWTRVTSGICVAR